MVYTSIRAVKKQHMPLDIQQPEKKTSRVFIRLEPSTHQKIMKLAREKKVEQSTLVRKLVELGLEHATE